MTWQDVLDAIREGRQSVPTAPNGVPLVAINAPVFELMQLMEAITTGYNANVQRIYDYERKIELLKKVAGEKFPGQRKEN